MRAPPSGSPAKIPDFRRTCRLKFEPRRRRRRPTPCNSTLPTCWGRQRSAATKIVRLLRSAAAAPGVPGLPVAAARRASEKHQPAAHGRPLSRRAIRKAAAKGPARNQHARGPTGSAGQVTLAAACPMGRGCNMQACRHHPTSHLARVGPASVRVQQHPARSSQYAAGRYLLRYQ